MDTFYATDSLSREKKEKLIRKAHSLCENWWFDKLDCSVSFARRVIPDTSFDEAMTHLVPGAFVTVIHRRPVCPADKEHIEVGFRSMENPIDYFLWVIVPMDRADKVLKGLKARN